MNQETQKRKVPAKEKKKRKAMKEEMLLHLEEIDSDALHFADMVEDYLSFWDVKNELIHDIKTRGVVITWRNSETQYGHKKNDSVSELVRVNAQMLKILTELNIKSYVKTTVGDVVDY